MKQLSGFDRLMLVAILLALLVNIASTYISDIDPIIVKLVGNFVIAILAIWVLYFISKNIYESFTSGRMAVEALILNQENKLLLYKHPYHKKFIPPGGRVQNNELPDQALIRALRERVGLIEDDYNFHGIIHNRSRHTEGYLENVERVIAPFIIQKELRSQRLGKKYHYDFLYVLSLTNNNFVFPENKYKPFFFVDKNKLNEVRASNDTFPDVVDAYSRVLSILEKET